MAPSALQSIVPDESAEDAARELAAARRSMEMEFDAKMRDLKAQHTRRMDRLKEEQADWEEHRRAQKKEIADKAEQVCRRVDNTQQKVELGTAQRKELEERREEVKGLERQQREAARVLQETQARLATTREALRTGRTRALVGMLFIAGTAGAAVAWPSQWARGLFAIAAAFAAVLVMGIKRSA